TMTTEAWDIKYKSNLGWNHAWGASPANIIVRKLMGLEPLEPAFKKIQIKPRPADLQYAEVKTPTIRGPVSVRFEHDRGRSFEQESEKPTKSTAIVILPTFDTTADNIEGTLNDDEVNSVSKSDFIEVDQITSGKHELIVDYTS